MILREEDLPQTGKRPRGNETKNVCYSTNNAPGQWGFALWSILYQRVEEVAQYTKLQRHLPPRHHHGLTRPWPICVPPVRHTK